MKQRTFRTKREASHCPICDCKTLPYFEKSANPFDKQWHSMQCINCMAYGLGELLKDVYSDGLSVAIAADFAVFREMRGTHEITEANRTVTIMPELDAVEVLDNELDKLLKVYPDMDGAIIPIGLLTDLIEYPEVVHRLVLTPPYTDGHYFKYWRQGKYIRIMEGRADFIALKGDNNA